MSRNKLYIILILACLTGYIWLYLSIHPTSSGFDEVGVCIIKHTTNIPCPSCGSTRSIISLLMGNIKEAFLINPFGIIVAGIMVILPLWISTDLIRRKQTLLVQYNKMELFLKKPQHSIPLILLVIINWIWNIAKGL
jgi:hypothetical protein